jgi:hypothetical protein
MDSQKSSQNALFLQDTFAKITWSSVRAEPEGRREQERVRKIDDLNATYRFARCWATSFATHRATFAHC